MRKRLIVLLTFLGGIYFFLEFVIPEKLPTPPNRSFDGALVLAGGTQTDGWFQFRTLQDASAAAARFGAKVEVPPVAASRPAKLRHTRYEVIVEIDSAPTDTFEEMGLWRTAKGGKWRIAVDIPPMAFERLMAAFEGKPRPGGGFGFETAERVLKVVGELGVEATLPGPFADRPALVKKYKKGKAFIKTGMTVSIPAQPDDSAQSGSVWKLENAKWTKALSAPYGISEIRQIIQEGKLDNATGRFDFKEASAAVAAAKEFGFDAKLPEAYLTRPAWLKRHKATFKPDELIVAVKSETGDSAEGMGGWRNEDGYWKRNFHEYLRVMELNKRSLASGARIGEEGLLVFPKLSMASQVLSEFGITVESPTPLADRPADVKRVEGVITIAVERQASDELAEMREWTLEPAAWKATYVAYSYFTFGGYHEEISNAFIVLGALAIGLGLINILRSHGVNMLMRRRGWIHSTALVVAMAVTIIVGFWDWSNSLREDGGLSVTWVSEQVGYVYKEAIIGLGGLLTGLSSAMFSLLAMYIAAAAYRAFRIKSGEAALMMFTALLVMIGQIPMGVALLDPVFHWFGIGGGAAIVRSWIMENINTAVFRAIEFGAGVAGLAMAMRMWFSMEAGAFYSEKE